MSQIDVYRHECLGMIRNGTYLDKKQCWIPIYRLKEDGKEFKAKAGDILVGGGSGECAAFRINMPENLLWWSKDDDEVVTDNDTEAFWSPTNAYEFGLGYALEGWGKDSRDMESFIVHHVLAFIIREYSKDYVDSIGSEPLRQDGSICRLPTPEEKKIYDGYKS